MFFCFSAKDVSDLSRSAPSWLITQCDAYFGRGKSVATIKFVVMLMFLSQEHDLFESPLVNLSDQSF